MTIEEQRALQRVENKIISLTELVERMSRALVGDEDFGIIGLVDDHNALKTEVRTMKAAMEADVKAIRAEIAVLSGIHKVLQWTARKWPYVAVASFLYLTGGDMASVWRFVEGIMR